MPINVSEIIINAPVQKVWDALTKPELVKQWQYGSELITSWEIGSEIRFETIWDGKLFEQWGKVLAVNTNELIKYTLFAPRPGLEDKAENYFIMSYMLNKEGERTKLSILQEDNRPGAVQEKAQGEENPILNSLKSLVEYSR
jgi:uncharacterized protein YndB with AHSA1/START domain